MHYRYVKIKLVEILPLSSYHPYILQKKIYTRSYASPYLRCIKRWMSCMFSMLYMREYIIYYTSVTLQYNRIYLMITLILASFLYTLGCYRPKRWQVNAMFSLQRQHCHKLQHGNAAFEPEKNIARACNDMVG